MTACVQAKKTAASSSNLPAFDTHVPFVGKVDFNSPSEWAWVAGLAADIFFVSGCAKWIIAAGIIAARYEFQKRRGS